MINENKKGIKMIKWIKKILKRKQKHYFDSNNTISAGTGVARIEEDGYTEIFVNGYKCLKCGKILWLDGWQLKDLPKEMKYCGASDTKVLPNGTRTEV